MREKNAVLFFKKYYRLVHNVTSKSKKIIRQIKIVNPPQQQLNGQTLPASVLEFLFIDFAVIKNIIFFQLKSFIFPIFFGFCMLVYFVMENVKLCARQYD